MLNQSMLVIITLVNVFIMIFSAFNIVRRKHIVNILASLSIASLIILEIGKFSLFFNTSFTERLLGLGLCSLAIFWVIFTASLLPSKSYYINRIVLSPLLCILSLVFFLIWWIKPFIILESANIVILPKIARYFFILFILDLSLSFSNLERSLYLLKQKELRLLLVSAAFLLSPYIFLATSAVLFSKINISLLTYSSLSVFIGAFILLFAAHKGLSFDVLGEDTAIHTSLTLFLIGGYLFFIGAFIKLFQVLGGNINALFSFFTILFIFFALLMLVFSSSFKERVKNIFFRHLTRQRYDWQKIWEDFTYKISLVTEIDKIKGNIEEAISKIIDVSEARVFIFGRDIPFEGEFCDWLLRRAESFPVKDIFENGLAQKFPLAGNFFKENRIDIASPLYGDKKVIGVIGLVVKGRKFLDNELLRVLSLQASSVIVNCWANQALRELEKKESIYKVSSFVIHDVKNYINNLSLLISNRDRFSKQEFQQDALFTLESTVGRMKKLINEFKTLRGDLVLQRKGCRLQGLVEEALKDIGKERLKNINLSQNISPAIIVNVDPNYLNRVIFNLILNAVEAMEGRGKLSIQSACGSEDAYLSIKDTGCGMAEGFLRNKLFRPFSSTKKKGLGIGLYQCKSIVEAHGGGIEVESRLGEGTEFTIKLPLAENVRSQSHKSQGHR